MIFKISSILRAEGSPSATSLEGISVMTGSTTFSFPLVSVLGLAAVMRMGAFIKTCGEILGENILPVLVTLLEPTILPTSPFFLLRFRHLV